MGFIIFVCVVDVLMLFIFSDRKSSLGLLRSLGMLEPVFEDVVSDLGHIEEKKKSHGRWNLIGMVVCCIGAFFAIKNTSIFLILVTEVIFIFTLYQHAVFTSINCEKKDVNASLCGKQITVSETEIYELPEGFHAIESIITNKGEQIKWTVGPTAIYVGGSGIVKVSFFREIKVDHEDPEAFERLGDTECIIHISENYWERTKLLFLYDCKTACFITNEEQMMQDSNHYKLDKNGFYIRKTAGMYWKLKRMDVNDGLESFKTSYSGLWYVKPYQNNLIQYNSQRMCFEHNGSLVEVEPIGNIYQLKPEKSYIIVERGTKLGGGKIEVEIGQGFNIGITFNSVSSISNNNRVVATQKEIQLLSNLATKNIALDSYVSNYLREEYQRLLQKDERLSALMQKSAVALSVFAKKYSEYAKQANFSNVFLVESEMSLFYEQMVTVFRECVRTVLLERVERNGLIYSSYDNGRIGVVIEGADKLMMIYKEQTQKLLDLREKERDDIVKYLKGIGDMPSVAQKHAIASANQFIAQGFNNDLADYEKKVEGYIDDKVKGTVDLQQQIKRQLQGVQVIDIKTRQKAKEAMVFADFVKDSGDISKLSVGDFNNWLKKTRKYEIM